MKNSKSLRTLEYDKILDMLSAYTASETGKRKAAEITPYNSFSESLYALNLTNEAYRIINVHSVSPSLSFDSVTDCILRAKKLSCLTMAEVLKVGRLLKVSRTVKSALIDIADDKIYDIKQISDRLYISFTLEKDIFRSILSENEMADIASAELKNIRKNIIRTNEKIREKLNSYITSSSTAIYLQDNIITMRNDRYVIPVKNEHRGHVSGLIHDQSASGSTVFIEPVMVVELNNELRLHLAAEEQEINRILQEFTSRINIVSDELMTNQDILTDLDLLFAKAAFAKSINAICPALNDTGYINIIKGRHPLIDGSAVVPVTVTLGKDYKILMITGPNTGGKTVTLKLTGLLTLMGMSGMFIPAVEGSEISFYDTVMCDIGDEQSIEQSLSTFSSHMTNIISITNNLNDKCLVLLDELGAGTDPQEGAALAMAITSRILKSGAYGVITTHYPELKEFAMVTGSVENASMDFDPETFKPAYSLVIGIPGASNAIQIAARLGLDEQIISNAKNLLSGEKIKFENVLIQAEEARRKAEQSKEELIIKHERLDTEIKRLENERARIIKEKERIVLNAEKETKRLIRQALEEVNEIVDELKEMLSDTDKIDIFKAHKLRKKLEDITVQTESEETTLPEGIDGEIRKGDRVYIKNLNNYGEVDDINAKGEFLVKIGALSAAIKKNDLIRVGDKPAEKQGISVNKPVNLGAVKSEINLIGLTADEAVYELDKFVNGAIMCGLNEIRIVHGKGSGKLRSTVQEYLNKSTLIKEFRRGVFGEGETGVTIVKLK